MQIIDHQSIIGTENRGNYIAIPELDRLAPSVPQFIQLADLSIVLDKPTAFIYVDGFSTSQSESGINTPSNNKYVPALKSGSSYAMHEWINTFKGRNHLVHANIVSSTCAAGIQAMHEADQLLKYRVVEEVIIIGGERITGDTLRLFGELRIPITCGDGFFYLKLNNEISSNGYVVTDVKWKYKYQTNPFLFTQKTLDTLIPDYLVDFVKLHGTGTKSNIEGEIGLSRIGTPIIYKNTIGHTQGISSLLETCLVLKDENIKGAILVTANGLGGFYGSFTLTK